MLKIAILVWIMLGTTLAGMLVTVVLTVPSLGADAMKLIPYAAGAGFVVAMPLSVMVAKRIIAQTAGR